MSGCDVWLQGVRRLFAACLAVCSALTHRLATRNTARAIPPSVCRSSGSSVRLPAQVPGWLVECLRLEVGHASTVRPDSSTLDVAGERGSHHESCLQVVPGCWSGLGAMPVS